MKRIELKSYCKVNLSIDVLGKLDNGYHQVDIVMVMIDLFDDVSVAFYEGKEKNIALKSNRRYLPTDERNIAYKACKVMWEKYGKNIFGTVRIDIKKNVPVSAGLAGGSGNGASVVLALNKLWNLKLSSEELLEIGKGLGADVPFSILGQIKGNQILSKDNLEGNFAVRARGIGTDLTRIKSCKGYVLLSKPKMGVSTKEVYKGLKINEIKERPNNDRLVLAMEKEDFKEIKKNMINVLETYTLKRYHKVMYTKNKMLELIGTGKVLMSGSGPTVFAFSNNKKELEIAKKELLKINKETYLVKILE